MNKIYAMTDDKITEREIKNALAAKKIACECMVLLKNENQTLPLNKKIKIALFGNGARNTIKGGTGSGDVNTRSFTNIETGLKNAGFVITSQAWLDKNEKFRNEKKTEYLNWIDSEAKAKNINPVYIAFDHPFTDPGIVEITDEEIKAAGCESDDVTAVFVISRNSGEGADRRNAKGDYQLSDTEADGLKKVASSFKKVVVVLNVGGIIQIKDVYENPDVSALLLMSQLGNLGGDALAEVLCGDSVPSGRLSDTWALDYMDYPSSATFSFNNGNLDDDYYNDGIYVGYRYFDSFDKEVLFPFGYGLGYTKFSQTVTSVAQKDNKLKIDVEVCNIGEKFSGKEVVQVYVSAPDGKLIKPYQELKAFAKSNELKPGEKETLEIAFNLENLASYDEKSSSWIIEKGNYLVRVGENSKETTVAATLVFDKDFVTEKCRKVLPLDCELQEIKPAAAKVAPAAQGIVINIDESKLTCKCNEYQKNRPEMKTDKTQILTLEDVKNKKCTLEELVAQLSVEEMATLCVGVFSHNKDKSVIGSASACVPGAAGETPDLLKDSRKIKKLILADGPAGVRLTPHFKTDKDGNLLPGGDVFGDTIRKFENVPEGAIDYYQYCTAIPIGWALAQSWDCEMVEKIGQMIGGEMQLFGVDLWLAPAQNIHKNPLCGRNFEYYSEDPLLTGKISAAITRGVQKNKGCGTTIKHFAANNQEENRYFVNAHISERTLREIYLKGFEIAVKESQPLSVMTSYNLLNGIHTANQYDLCQTLLRDEWDFGGVVMTDWFTSQHMPSMMGKYKPKYPISASTGCIAAGNDLQMPGCQQNIDDIVDSVKNNKEIDGYKISLGDLQFCTYNLLKVILKLEA